MLIAALIGFAFGFLGSIPVAGPVSMLVFGRGLQDRARSAMFLALGAALAESAYAFLAFWGFSALLAAHPWIEPICHGTAAVLLVALGLAFAWKKPEPELATAPSLAGDGKRSFLLGFTITALNPTIILTWTGAVTMLQSSELVRFDGGHALPFALGVCLGIGLWFALLLALLARLKTRFHRSTLDRVVQIMGALLALLGLYLVARFALGLISPDG